MSEPTPFIEYRIVRQGTEGNGIDHEESLVARVRCAQCRQDVCVAQTKDWPPTGPVVLLVGINWPDPVVRGNYVLCPHCGGGTTTQ